MIRWYCPRNNNSHIFSNTPRTDIAKTKKQKNKKRRRKKKCARVTMKRLGNSIWIRMKEIGNFIIVLFWRVRDYKTFDTNVGMWNKGNDV